MLHQAYNESKKSLFVRRRINRKIFMCMTAYKLRETCMCMLGDFWPTWAGKEAVIKSFKRCVVTHERLDVKFMQQDKFAPAALINGPEIDTLNDLKTTIKINELSNIDFT